MSVNNFDGNRYSVGIDRLGKREDYADMRHFFVTGMDEENNEITNGENP